ncbi:MAG: flagellar biosynthesis anti-sigma factor FlgM [Nitrospirae bacterium]|nr:MAG: flagellar biosynthesis anti-sigma factor FlgM [Nitrospirota bacterium]
MIDPHDSLGPITDSLSLRPESSRIDPARPVPQLSSVPPSRDRVELSEDERESRAIREAIARLPEIREDRLHHLRHLLESGAYHVHAAQVAERLIQHILRDGSRRHSS